MAIAGKVAPVPRGAYNASTTYNKIDIVTYNGDTYMSLQGSNIGHTPTKSSNSWWICIFEFPSVFTGASSSAAGAKGLVPAPASGDQNKVLKGNGSWAGNVGHQVLNSSGTAMTQREKLRFDGCTVTDDSTNDVTKVTPNTAAADTFVGTCDTAAATAAKVATVTGTFALREGTIVSIKFTNTNTAENPTLNVNNSGAKAVWYGTGVITTSSKDRAGYANRYTNFVYNGTNWVWIGWSVDNDTTYTPQKLGIGYGTCSTAAATAAKIVNWSDYTLVKNGIVSIKFTYAVPASATLNINSKGAKPIYYKGAAITAGIIGAGDLATFMYDGTNYHLISIAGKAGHTILNNGATAQTSRDNLQFVKMNVTDDSANNRTKVTPNPPIAVCTCPTAADTAAKVISISNTATGFSLEAGTIISVKFTYTNSASNPTFNVANTGAKSVYYNTGVITTSNLNKAGYANRYENYVYDGTNWVWIGHGSDDNTTYSTLTTAQIDAGTETTAKVATAKVIHDAITNRVKDSLSNTSTTDALSAAKGKALQDRIDDLQDAAENKVLFFANVACSATTGNFLTKSDAKITANHILTECVFANPSAITTDVTWTTANGSLTLNGTCTSATTATITLVKKDN